jgi:hypothetical protein
VKSDWSAAERVLATFHGCTKRERERLMEMFEQIAAFPANHADRCEKGPDGRSYSVRKSGSWIVTWWIDTDHEMVWFVGLRRAA